MLGNFVVGSCFNAKLFQNNKTLNAGRLLTYFDDNKILFTNIQLFAGDLFFKDLIFFDIIERLYNYYEKIYQQEKLFFNNNYISIMTPTNFSFVNNDNILPEILKWKNKFLNINIYLNFSASIDGKVLTSNRENKKIEEIDEYYDKIFKAIKILDAGVHPMISSIGIEKWIENYKWFIDQYEKYNLVIPYYDNMPMLLEVRNNDWDDKSIQHYLNFLNYLINERLKMCNNSIKELAYHLFCGDGKYNTLKETVNYDILKIHYKENSYDNYNCSLSDNLTITLNNLKIVPCHRLTYPQLAGGQFIKENDKITHITAINPSGYIGLHTNSPQVHSKCLECPIHHLCIKGCYGSQFEEHGDPLILNNTVCKLYVEKFKFLLKKYYDLGVLKEFFNNNYGSQQLKLEIINLCNIFNIFDETEEIK